MKGDLGRSLPTRLARALRWSGAGAALAIAAFHLELLAGRLGDATIVRPDVAIRWLASAGIVAVGLDLWRRRALWRGRRAWILALVVLVLHLGAPPTSSSPALAGWLAALPAGIAFACAASVAASKREATPSAHGLAVALPSFARRPGAGRLGGLVCRFVPRPPPRFAPAL